MRNVEYRVLEYAHSELAAKGENLLAVLRSADMEEARLHAFLRQDWRLVVEGASELASEYVEDVLYDVRQHLLEDSKDNVAVFFDAIAELSVGPLRTLGAGFARVEKEEVLQSFLNGSSGEIICPTADEFNSMVSSLLDPANQLQAARTRA